MTLGATALAPNPDFSAIVRIFSGAQLNRDVEAELNWAPSTNHSSRQIEGHWPHLSDRILVAGPLSIVFFVCFVVLRRGRCDIDQAAWSQLERLRESGRVAASCKWPAQDES